MLVILFLSLSAFDRFDFEYAVYDSICRPVTESMSYLKSTNNINDKS